MALLKSCKKRQRKYAVVFIAFSCLIFIPSLSRAQALQANGLPSSYPQTRQTVAQQQYPWRSIGSISIAGRQFCTATLISETQILTAAHCLWNEDHESWYPAPFIHFLAGYEKGEYLSHSMAVSITPSRHYRFTSPPTLDSLRHDWALLTLKKPLGKMLGFIPLRRNDTDRKETQTLQLAGYRQDRPEVLSVAKECQRKQAQHTPASLIGFLIHSCEALSGDSGGPLLSGAHSDSIEAGSVFVEGVHVGRQHNQSRSDSLAVTAQAIATEIKTPRSKRVSASH